MPVETIYVQDSGIQDALNSWTNQATPSLLSGGKVHLFKNNVTIDKTTALSALTESTFPGYSALSVATHTYPAASVASHLASSLASAAYQFQCTGGGSSEQAYGAYITDSGGTKLLCAWNFLAGPFTMVNNGDTVNTQPTLTQASAN